MFITKKVFDPSLLTKAVYIVGQDANGGIWDNVFLVSKVDGDLINLITNTGIIIKFHMDNFESGILSMDVLEPPKSDFSQDLPFDDISSDEPLWEIVKDEEKRQLDIKKPKKDIQRRTDAQQLQDARLVADVLQRNNRAMKVYEILNAVNAAGANWKEQSATGHIYKAMEKFPAIKKVGFGLYKYEN